MCVCVDKVDVWEADKLVYLSPAVSTATQYNISVQLDGTLSAPQDQTFTVLENPILTKFDNDKKTHVGEVLQLSVCHQRLLIRELYHHHHHHHRRRHRHRHRHHHHIE